MCKKQTYILKVSNRGTNVYESYLRTTYEVNIPNLPIMGFDTEVASGFSCQNFTTLFNVDLTSYHTNNINMPINITNSIGPFRCGSLPEKLTFQRYATTAGVKELFDTGSGNSDYISFTLSIEFDD